MTDYLKVYEKLKDVKEVRDYIDDVTLLRHYYGNQQFSEMQEHIRKLMLKYPLEVIAWNTVNSIMPNTYEQAYINAENFLQMQGAKIVLKATSNYKHNLTEDEEAFIESMIKPME